MDIKDIKIKKWELKTNIEKLLNAFSKETDVNISEIRIKETANSQNCGSTNKVYFVNVDISI